MISTSCAAGWLAVPPRPAKVSVGPRGLHTARVKRGQIGKNGLDRRADQKLGQVHPVGADVGDGAKICPAVGLDPPVVVVGVEQPVLHVRAGHTENAAQAPLAIRSRISWQSG